MHRICAKHYCCCCFKRSQLLLRYIPTGRIDAHLAGSCFCQDQPGRHDKTKVDYTNFAPPLKKQESLRTIPNASINSEKWISAAAPTKTERKAVNEKYSKANELPTVSVSEVTAEMCFSLTLPRVVYLSQRSGLILCCV
eukprot:GHVU01179139.1.p1 GENE.GHVU01179139.1~~GHVU01179139.1.p1  ORF type:complete len:139 (-),score=7.48 GHVU01179139.1:165-581(-)